MGYEANVFNVMIASPIDVPNEREIVRGVVHEWNAVHSAKRRIVLLPVGWETHSSPEMGAPAQQIINSQVLDQCDLLVGVFWTRLGTPTKTHPSGTVEEIERHIASGKPAMLYFSGQPVVWDTVDSAEMQKLKMFKQSCQSRGLYETYASPSEFKEKFYRQLQLKVNDHQLFHVGDDVAVETSVVESDTEIPDLSLEARILLKEASEDDRGTILYLRTLDGTHMQTNGKNLITSNAHREASKWEGALGELTSYDLVVARGEKGEVFEVTNRGYQMAAMVNP